MSHWWRFSGPGELIFGCGCLSELGELIERHHWSYVLVVSDRKLAEVGITDRVVAACRPAHRVDVFDRGRPEPPISLATELADLVAVEQPDVLIGVGGGSNIDLAKSAALLARYGAPIDNYLGDSKVPGPILPVIGVPTTAGTGSEVSCAAVLTDEAKRMKVAILSRYLRPVAAVVDPELTRSCPPRVTGDAGIDALAHAIEAYTAIDYRDFTPEEPTVYQGAFPMTDLLAEKAIELIGRYLVRAYQNGDDMEAREGMALAATLAGLAFSNACVGIVHAMEYPVGGAVHCSHGCGNGILLPHAMRFNLEARRERFARIAHLLGAAGPDTPVNEAAEAAIAAVEKLRDAVGIPARLREVGVKREQLNEFAVKAYAIQRVIRLNPRPVRGQDLLAIYQAAY